MIDQRRGLGASPVFYFWTISAAYPPSWPASSAGAMAVLSTTNHDRSYKQSARLHEAQLMLTRCWASALTGSASRMKSELVRARWTATGGRPSRCSVCIQSLRPSVLRVAAPSLQASCQLCQSDGACAAMDADRSVIQPLRRRTVAASPGTRQSGRTHLRCPQMLPQPHRCQSDRQLRQRRDRHTIRYEGQPDPAGSSYRRPHRNCRSPLSAQPTHAAPGQALKKVCIDPIGHERHHRPSDRDSGAESSRVSVLSVWLVTSSQCGASSWQDPHRGYR